MENKIVKIILKISNMTNRREYKIDLLSKKMSADFCGLHVGKSFSNKKIDYESYKKFGKKLKTIHFDNWKDYYSANFGYMVMTDGEKWKLVLIYKDDTKKIFEGYMAYPSEWYNLLDAIKVLSNPFDENSLSKIKIVVNRKAKYFEKGFSKLLSFNFKSEFECDAKKGIVKTQQVDELGNVISKKLYLGYEVAETLSYLIIENKKKRKKNLRINLNNIIKYRISTETYNHKIQRFNGYYIKEDLPQNWEEVLEDLQELVKKVEHNDIFEEVLFENSIEKGKYKVVVVQFDDGREFSYLTTDESIVNGNYVSVPFGRDNEIKNGFVIKIEYMTKEELPFPLEKFKSILSKD